MLAASHLWAVCSDHSCLCKALACALGHRKQKSVEGAREMSSLSDKTESHAGDGQNILSRALSRKYPQCPLIPTPSPGFAHGPPLVLVNLLITEKY